MGYNSLWNCISWNKIQIITLDRSLRKYKISRMAKALRQEIINDFGYNYATHFNCLWIRIGISWWQVFLSRTPLGEGAYPASFLPDFLDCSKMAAAIDASLSISYPASVWRLDKNLRIVLRSKLPNNPPIFWVNYDLTSCFAISGKKRQYSKAP